MDHKTNRDELGGRTARTELTDAKEPGQTMPERENQRESSAGVTRFKLPPCCKNFEHVPAIVHRCGGLNAETHNTCGKCGRVIIKLGETWIVDVYREDPENQGNQ